MTTVDGYGASPRTAWCILVLSCVLAADPVGVAAQEARATPRAEILEGDPRDFDFEMGTWSVRLSRLLHPLTGSTEWVEYEGISVVRPVWDGRANLGEIEVEGPAGRIQGLSLRVYNPEARQWRIHWSSADDGSKTWEPNWIAEFERVGEAPGSLRAFWAELDRVWATRDAARFSELFAEDASFTFVSTGPELRGRDAIHRHFAGRFPEIAPEVRHRSTVAAAREVAPGLVAMDGSVEILGPPANGAGERPVLLTFSTYALMHRRGADWTIGELRAYRRPDSAVLDTGGAADRSEPRAETVAVEIRSYDLLPGTRAEFHRIAHEEAAPMLRRWGMDVVGYGPSQHDEDSYVMIRAFPSVEARQREEDAFYGSAEWRDGPREAVLSRIESYTTVVLELDREAVERLRRALENGR